MNSEDKKPAEENPWYVLMTIAGEQEEWHTDDALHKKNLRYWNGFIAQHFDINKLQNRVTKIFNFHKLQKGAYYEDIKEKISECFSQPLSDTEYEEIITAIKNRIPDEDPLELIQQLRLSQATDFSDTEFARKKIDFSNIKFTKPLCCNGFIFPEYVNFNGAVFKHKSSFADALFISRSDFSNATLSASIFDNATFLGAADFELTEFAMYTFFRNAKFINIANFTGSKFNEIHFNKTIFLYVADYIGTEFSFIASFREAKFNQFVCFLDAKFEKVYFINTFFSHNADFSNAKFNSKTSFESTHFINVPPEFYNAVLHENTDWTDAKWPPVPKKPTDASSSRLAYERLKLIMAQQNKFADEHMFLREELKCRERENPKSVTAFCSRIYRRTSDYGWSVKKPAFCLLGVWLLGAILIGGIEYFSDSPSIESWISIKISLANTFSFLGISRFVNDGMPLKLTILSETISFIQIFLGLIFSFLLGLGLRNRFRIK